MIFDANTNNPMAYGAKLDPEMIDTTFIMSRN